jgi:hypothetical protein
MTAREPGQIAPADLGLDGYGELRILDDRGLGTLFETHDVLHDRPILVRVGTGGDAQTLRRAFSKWCQVGGHPNVVTAFNLNSNADGTVAAVELERSTESLEERLRATGPLPFVQVLALGASVAGALAELHRHDIVHGSVGASSVMLAVDGRPQLTDIALHDDLEPTAAGFAEDVRALGLLLAAALGATGGSEAGHAESDPNRLAWDRAVEVPDRVRDEVDAAVSGLVADADLLHQRFTELHVHYTGRRPDTLGAVQTWIGDPSFSDPATPAGPLVDDPSRSTLTHHRDAVVEPSPSWLDGHSDANPSWYGAEPDHVGDDAPAAAPAGRRRVTPLAVAAVVGVALIVAVALAVVLLSARSEEGEGAATTAPTTTAPTTTTGDVVDDPPRPVPPAAATDVAAEYIAQGSVRLGWTHNASVDEGYLIRVQRFRHDSRTGRTLGEPVSSGWVGSDLTEGRSPGDLLPAGTTQVELSLPSPGGPDVITCLKPVAVTRGRQPVESAGEPVCLPVAAPSAPGIDLREVQPHPPGALRLEWTDTSFDEDGFVVAEIGPDDDVIAHWRTTAPRVDSIVLAPGTRRCFVVKAENARNYADPPVLFDDGSVTAPFCFDVG